ncbi:MAG: ribosome-associated protein [Flavobacteriaceae bacterium]|jgi:ribosome-associated protein|tara:strand:- start:65 stop:436 length:372 start_codon:yes stop_codon:yes gene_type:complete
MINKIYSIQSLLDEIVIGIENIKGEEILILNLREIDNTPCDYFVICSGNSNTQVSAIVGSIQKNVSKIIHEKPLHTEGSEVAEWILMDYVNVVVHVFQKHIREYYNIEELWGDAKSTQIISNY